jgi:cytochrome c oxidase cbb3-type subunit 3
VESGPGEDAHIAAPIGPQRRRLPRIGWKTVAALVVTALAVAGVAIHFASQASLRARLLRADPDAIANDTELTSFAIAIGQPAYDRHCATCHGAQMQGDRDRGAPNLADDDWLYGDGEAAQIERTILHGIRSGDPKGWNLADMPAFSEPEPYSRYKLTPLEPNDIRDVVEFLLVSAGKPGDQAAAERGSAIFQAKGQCYDCHATDAKGDTAIGAPNLLDDIWLSGNGTREDIFNIVAHGRRGYCPAWGRQLDAATVRALAVLVYLASHAESSHAASPPAGGSAGRAG